MEPHFIDNEERQRLRAKRKKRNSIRTSTTKCSGRANSKTMKMNKKQEIENRKGLRE